MSNGSRPSGSPRLRIAVIGGGWAGLAAAVEATAAGAEVTLFEAGRSLGGRARSLPLATADGPLTLDNGQHILLGAYRDTLALMRRVGADPERLLLRRPLQVLDNTGFSLRLPQLPAPLPATLATAWGLLGCSPVSLAEKLRTARWMLGVQLRGFRVEPEQSVATWLDAAGQHGRLRRHLWEPLCLAALNTPAERASAQRFAKVLRDSLGSTQRGATDLLLPRVPFGELLPEPAAHWLQTHGAQIRLGRRISQLHPGDGSIAVDGEPFAQVIVATAAQHAAKLWPETRVPQAWEPIATVYLRYPAKTRLPYPLHSLLGQSTAGQEIGAFWAVDRSQALNPAEQGIIAAVLSGHGDWCRLSDAQLHAAVCAELASLPGLPASAACLQIVREKRATFSCRPGQLAQSCASSHPRLFFAGDHTWSDYPATLEGAVRSGLRAARTVLAGPGNIG
ncbi:hydroxysqualene dehydroxylase HpnE [Dechloromonas sp. ZY10]|uniref:hydroxysqualene dehydroxylase HpnE n=1 Tax=Dechloromonas aquae TaxID=2664436 RepID=UPI00352763D8